MTASIYAALAKAQAEMGKAIKDSNNPHFRSKYADLGNVIDAAMPALNKHGIAVIQPLVKTDDGYGIETTLLHESGETISGGIVPLLIGKQDMQGLGSAITYARRYGLMTAVGIAPEDDDGNAAVASGPAKPFPKAARKKPDTDWPAMADGMVKDLRGNFHVVVNNPNFKRDLANMQRHDPESAARVEAEIATQEKAHQPDN